MRVSTGIKGLDEMLDGGFPEGRVILLCGGPGTGKTIFSLQFLAAAAERGEHGVYVTLEEPKSLVLENVEVFGWKLREREANKTFRVLDFCAVPFGVETYEVKSRDTGDIVLSMTKDLVNAVKEINAKCVVLDPLNSITVHEQRAGLKRYRIASIFDELRNLRVTSVLTSEVTSHEDFYMEEFLADGVIWLEKSIQNFNLIKTVRIEKMRGVKHDEQPRRYIINDKGITVYNTEPVKF
ncbi:MAG: ATPase domain-containing protein [Candidatus Bathyarchaeia archaeon]